MIARIVIILTIDGLVENEDSYHPQQVIISKIAKVAPAKNILIL